MSQDDARSRVSQQHIDDLKRHRQIVADVAEGRHLPSLEELYQGVGFMSGDWREDCKTWVDDLLLGVFPDDCKDRLIHLRKTLSTGALRDCRTAFEFESGDAVDRIDFYLTAAGDTQAHHRVLSQTLGERWGLMHHRRLAFGLSLAWSTGVLTEPKAPLHRSEISIKSAADDIALAEATGKILDAGETVQSAQDALLEKLAEVTAEFEPEDPDAEPEQPQGLIVVPKLAAGTGQKKEINKLWAQIAGERMPLVKAPNIQDAVERFRLLLPHAVEVFAKAIGHMQQGDDIRIAPVLLVGGAGTGKTTMAKAIGEILGLPSEIHGMAGASDSSLMGTSAQWGSARENDVLHAVRLSGVANPLVIWDELEKVGSNRHNGNASEAMLPLLEQHTAKRFRDPALEVEVDLSMVSHIATANSLERIPKPLLDRFRIIRMPEPTWQHVGVLSRSILDRIAEERALDARWFPGLAGDELELIRQSWTGGSIRKLEQIVRIIVDGRDRLLRH